MKFHFFNFINYLFLINLFVGLPLVFLSVKQRTLLPLIAAFWMFIVIVFDHFLVYLPSILGIKSFYWNWEGKILELLWPLLVVFGFKWMSPKEVGYLLPKKDFGWTLSLGLAMVFPLIILLGYLFGLDPSDSNRPPSREDLLFQFTMPGLVEEPIWRGINLASLNRYLKDRWRIFNVLLGWGWILSSFLFAMFHFVQFDSTEGRIMFFWDWPISTIYQVLIMAGFLIVSFGWGYLREKTESFWPCILSHNLSNGLGFIIKMV